MKYGVYSLHGLIYALRLAYIHGWHSILYESKRLVAKEFLVFFRYKSSPTVSTVLYLWFVKVDVDLRMTQSSSSITEGVATSDDLHRLFSNKVDGKLFVDLST